MAILSTSPSSRPSPAFTIPSILALIAAIASFRSGAAFGMILAVAAIVLGLMGSAMAVLPGKRGGILSVASILMGVIGIIAAVFKLMGHVF